MKHCPKCNTDKPESEFYVQKRRNGTARLSGYCRLCTRVHYLTPRTKAQSRQKTLEKTATINAAWSDLTGEVWVDCLGYEGYYQVSNKSRVRSLYMDRYHELSFPVNKVLGYRYATLSVDGDHTTVYLHRLVAIAFIPNPNNYEEINHKDGNKTNNDISNLEWCTSQQNIQHAITVLKKHGSLKGKSNV